jgi:RimJ/RimL family protein N-acetyltransferase
LTTASTSCAVMSPWTSVMSMAASLPHVTDSHEGPVSETAEVFRTGRLVARPWTLADVDRHFDMYSRWEVARWLGSAPAPLRSREESVARIERWSLGIRRDRRFGLWAIEVAETRVVVGSVLLVPIPLTGEERPRPPEEGGDVEVGWHLHPDSWGHGYATEAAQGALAKAWSDGLAEVVAVVYAGNEPSLRVCQRLGMEPTGPTQKWYGVELEAFRIRRPA